jgi:hypothetical protein
LSLNRPAKIREELPGEVCASSHVKEILEEHLGEYEKKYLVLERLNYKHEAERILELYSEVPLFNQNLSGTLGYSRHWLFLFLTIKKPCISSPSEAGVEDFRGYTGPPFLCLNMNSL